MPARYNRATPSTLSAEDSERLHMIGSSQRHLFYSILRLGLPCPVATSMRSMNGHEDGLISLRVAEANDDVRQAVRVPMRKPYRTLLGHFRNEIDHFYFQQLVETSDMLEETRRVFGDERDDYATALKTSFQNRPPSNWPEHFISTYASCHLSEDFAECRAHYFHIADAGESARAFRVSIDPKTHQDLETQVRFNPYRASSAQQFVDAWMPISRALNPLP
ncbi:MULTISPECIES: putative zinc-binding metallopeptidase [Ochrobactrum]|uniref:putative zinc-binding metallopeptidase n=1 Tax=Ochrobactrum TaxID=528 RepID=UPI00296E900F|nr:putative zinc-binding metallopeptidase [Ochrobactrum sp. AN78]